MGDVVQFRAEHTIKRIHESIARNGCAGATRCCPELASYSGSSAGKRGGGGGLHQHTRGQRMVDAHLVPPHQMLYSLIRSKVDSVGRT